MTSPATKAVGWALVQWAGWTDGQSVRPGLSRLAAHACVAEETAGRALGQIRDWGLIWRTERGNRRRRLADVYRLTLPMDLSGVPLLPERGDRDD